MLKKRGEMADSPIAPIAFVGGLLLYSITSPTVYSNMGHLFFYPLYSSYGLQCLYTTGTWLWVYSIIWIVAKCCNDKFNPTFYKFFCGASLYAYLSHYFFILVISVLVIRPYKFTFIPALCIMLFGTFAALIVTYAPRVFRYELFVPEKETKKMEIDGDKPVEEELEAEDQMLETPEADAAARAKAEAIEKGSQGARDLENFDGESGISGEQMMQDDDLISQ